MWRRSNHNLGFHMTLSPASRNMCRNGQCGTKRYIETCHEKLWLRCGLAFTVDGRCWPATITSPRRYMSWSWPHEPQSCRPLASQWTRFVTGQDLKNRQQNSQKLISTTVTHAGSAPNENNLSGLSVAPQKLKRIDWVWSRVALFQRRCASAPRLLLQVNVHK